MKPMRWMDTAVAVVGPFSFLSLIGFFLALHDVWWDYASPAVWAHTGQWTPNITALAALREAVRQLA